MPRYRRCARSSVEGSRNAALVDNAPPIATRGKLAVFPENVTAHLVAEFPAVLAERNDRPVSLRQVLHNLPGAVAASVVEDEYPIRPARGRRQVFRDDVRLVLDEADRKKSPFGGFSGFSRTMAFDGRQRVRYLKNLRREKLFPSVR